jgi:hypothetical protein
MHGQCVDVADGHECVCDSGWTGDTCNEVDDCTPDPCHNGVCSNGIGGFACKCDPGWVGAVCDEQPDVCLPNPCLNNGVCSALTGDYQCGCEPGWTGKDCGTQVENGGVNLIENGDFEQGEAGWTGFGPIWSIVTGSVGSNAPSQLARYSTPGGKIYLYQDVPVQPDTTYEVGGWLRVEPGSIPIFLLSVDDVEFTGDYVVSPNQLRPRYDGVWRLYKATFNSGVLASVRLRLWGNSGFVGMAWADDLYLTPVD